MKISLPILVLSLFCLTEAHAEIKDFIYDGKEVYVRVKKEHLTTVIFPEAVHEVIRGFGADQYLIQRNDQKPDTLELMATGPETAEMTVTGATGEIYVLRLVPAENYYTKMTIRKLAAVAQKNDAHTVMAKLDIQPSAIIEKKAPQAPPKGNADLPEVLNDKITLKGNDLPLKIYLSTISQVTHLNVITTPDIDAQKTSLNLERIEVWRALKSLLYKFGYGFKVSQEDLIITETETRIFNINTPAVDQSFIDETSNESFDESNGNNTNGVNTPVNQQQPQNVKVGTKIYYENSSPKLSLWSDLENNIKSLLTPQTGTYSTNKVGGSIIVTDKPAVLDKIGELVSTLNESLSRQESFEIQIIEVTLSHNHETGIDWNAIAKSLKGLNTITGATHFSTAGFLSGQLLTLTAAGPHADSGTSSNGVNMVLKALDAMGYVNVISKPSITVSNMFPCVIQEVTSIPFISGTGQTIGNNVTQSNVTTSQVSDGLTMRLEAKIDQDKTVLNVSAAVNTLDAITDVPVGNGLTIQEPQVSTKSITTNVGVVPGKTLIPGGFISPTRNTSNQGVPYFNKKPNPGHAYCL